jgi:hypothetical protein
MRIVKDEEKLAMLEKVDKLRKDGMSAEEACKEAKVHQSNYSYWFTKRNKGYFKNGKQKTEVIHYRKPVSHKKKQHVSAPVSKTVALIVGDMETVREFYRMLQ